MSISDHSRYTRAPFSMGTQVGDSRTIATQIISQRDITLRAGDYVLTEPLPPMRPYQRIRGTPPGTRIVINYKVPDGNSEAVFDMVTDCEIQGPIEFWSPHINGALRPTVLDIQRDPWCIRIAYGYGRSGTGPNDPVTRCKIRDVVLVNPVRGIDCYGDNYHIENITGMPVYRGIRCDTNGHLAQLYNCRLNDPSFITPEEFETGELIIWMRANAVAFTFGRIDQLQATDLFAARYWKGLLFQGSDPIYDNDFWKSTGTYGHVQGGGFECTNAIWIDALRPDSTNPFWQGNNSWPGSSGVKFSNMYFVGTGYSVYINSPLDRFGNKWPERESDISMTNCRFIADAPFNQNELPLIYMPSGKLELSACRMYSNTDSPNWPLTNFFFHGESGEFNMQGGMVIGQPLSRAIRLENDMRAAIINGVKGLGGGGRIANAMNAGTYAFDNLLPP